MNINSVNPASFVSRQSYKPEKPAVWKTMLCSLLLLGTSQSVELPRRSFTCPLTLGHSAEKTSLFFIESRLPPQGNLQGMLWKALLYDNIDETRLLLSKGAIPNSLDIRAVILMGNFKAVELLSEQNFVDYDVPFLVDFGYTPLTLAVVLGSIDFGSSGFNDRYFRIVQCLLEAGANPDKKFLDTFTKRFESPLEYLSSLESPNSHEEMLLSLLFQYSKCIC